MLLKHFATAVYSAYNWQIENYEAEKEGKAYAACRFKLADKVMICRQAKITPKKVGCFVTFWKRDTNGNTSPICKDDIFDFYVVNVQEGKRVGQFVFPKAVLLKMGYIKSLTSTGKRGFRVYAPWLDEVKLNAQARKTRKWQMDYFYELTNDFDLQLVKKLYT